MSETIKIQVYTESSPGEGEDEQTGGLAKTPVTDATVALLTREEAEGDDDDKKYPFFSLDSTHQHHDQGFYVSGSDDPLPPGEYVLVARTSELATVVQKLTLEVKRGVLTVSAGWGKKRGAKHQAATVSIVNVGPRASPSSDTPRFATINVVLLPRTQWVGLACHNHFSRQGIDGTRYLPFARGRRNTLYAAGKIDKATLCTFLDCQGRKVLVTVKSAHPSRYSFVTIHEKDPFDPLEGDDGKRPHETSEREIGIEQFYDFIDSVGWIHPGTLLEAGVFGHGWVQGPIVWGTSDFSQGTERWGGGGGTPKDLDGRQGDFISRGDRRSTGEVAGPVLMDTWPMLQDAFAEGGSLRLFGCVHMNNVLAQCRTANKRLDDGLPRNEFFEVRISGGRILTTLDHVKKNVALNFASTLFGRPLEHGDCRGVVAYPGAAARFMDPVAVFAAPAGMGSNYGKNGKDNIMLISAAGENAKPHKWWQREFADVLEYDDLRYVNYTKLLGASLPDPGWRTQRCAVLFDDDSQHYNGNSFAVLRLASGLEAMFVSSAARGRMFGRPVAHTFAGKDGHLHAIRGAIGEGVLVRPIGRILMLSADTQKDCALFVDETGQTTYLEGPRGAKPADFAVPSEAMEIRQASYKYRNAWGVPAVPPLGDVQAGVIEKVDPKWYW